MTPFAASFLLQKIKTKEAVFMKLNCEFFYGKEADNFRFYRIPQVLVTDERFKDLSYGAKILYGLFLDRVGLSNKNGWRDEFGRTFIIYSVSEVMEDMNCSKVTAIKMTNELEKAGLLEKKRRGLGMPNVMYLKKFIAEV
jgi:hypothetical protein